MDQKTKSGRRQFLMAAGVGGVGAAAAVLGARTVAGDNAATQTGPAKAKGYQLTEHVRNYYRTTRT